MNSEFRNPGFRARLAKVIGDEEPFVWAKKIGIPSGTFARIWNEGTVPKAEHLVKISDKTDTDLNWLLSGQPRRSSAHDLIDQVLLGRCTDAFGKLYKEMGITLSMSDLGSLAAQAYNDLAAAGAGDMDIPTQLAMIRSLVERHRREILAEATANRQGKLSAS